MRASHVVVIEPVGEDALEMAPVKDQNPVEALATSRADLPLHVGIGFGRCNRRSDHLYAFSLEDKIRSSAVLGVVIVDDEPRVDSDLGEFPADVSRLLGYSDRVWPIGDSEPDHPPRGQIHI